MDCCTMRSTTVGIPKRRFLPPRPRKQALVLGSVRRGRCLPLTSFRFHLVMDTLVSLAMQFPLLRSARDLPSLAGTHAGPTKNRN